MNATVRLYGIDTCDQVRAARRWLRLRGIQVQWHDFRREGLDAALLSAWLSHLPWDALLNRRGQTWRQLPPDERTRVVDATSASELMLRLPTLIKRPVLEVQERIVVGFSEALYTSVFGPDAPLPSPSPSPKES
jgi:arsenate reductase